MLNIDPGQATSLSAYFPAGLRVIEGATAVARAVAEVKRRLLDAELSPGQKIPFDEIAAALDVSRTPLREAMHRLEAEGLVVSIPNRGFVVRRRDAKEMDQLFEARIAIEPYLAVQAHSRRDAKFLENLRGIQALYAKTLHETPYRRRFAMIADKAFHQCIAEHAGNPYLTELGNTIFDHFIFTRPLEGFPVSRADEAVEEHEAILSAMQGDDPMAVQSAIFSNISNGRASIAAYLAQRDHDTITR